MNGVTIQNSPAGSRLREVGSAPSRSCLLDDVGVREGLRRLGGQVQIGCEAGVVKGFSPVPPFNRCLIMSAVPDERSGHQELAWQLTVCLTPVLLGGEEAAFRCAHGRPRLHFLLNLVPRLLGTGTPAGFPREISGHA